MSFLRLLIIEITCLNFFKNDTTETMLSSDPMVAILNFLVNICAATHLGFNEEWIVVE